MNLARWDPRVASPSRHIGLTRCHGVDRNVSCAGLQLKRVARMEVSYRGVRQGASGGLGLDCVALRGPLGSQWAAVELGFLEISL